MGKIKVMSKYRLIGKALPMLLIFVLVVFSVFILGNFSYLVSQTFIMSDIDFSSERLKITVKAAVSLIGIILLLFIASPLRLGSERWFLLAAKGEGPKLRELFHYFNSYGILKSIAAVLYISLRKAAALILFLFPSMCLFGVLYFSFKEGEISLYISYALLVFTLILFLSGICFYFVYTARSFAYYSIIVSNKSIKPSFAFEKSLEITKGAYRRITMFKLSFLPWFLLCALIFPTFYVWGYYREARAMLSLHNDKLHS